MLKLPLLATFATLLGAGCATDTNDIDLGYLAVPGETLANATFVLVPGQTLRFQNDVNQIFGVSDLDHVAGPSEQLRVRSRIVAERDGGAGDTTREELTVTVAGDALVGSEHTLVTITPYQVRNDPDWAFSFFVVVANDDD